MTIESPEELLLQKELLAIDKDIYISQEVKQLEDIKSIFKIAKPDLNYIKVWAAKTSTSEILEEILKNNE